MQQKDEVMDEIPDENPQLTQFKIKISNILPRIECLNLNLLEWQDLQAACAHRKKLSNKFLFSTLSKNLKVNPYTLIDQLTHSTLKRKAHIERGIPAKKPKIMHIYGDDGDNSLILRKTDTNTPLQEAVLTHKMVSQELFPASPQKPYPSDVKMMRNADGVKLYCFYECNGYQVFKVPTPPGDKYNQGYFVPQKIPNPNFEAEETKTVEVSYTATKQSIETWAGVPRFQSQKQIKGETASNIVEKRGYPIVYKDNGKKESHWDLGHLETHSHVGPTLDPKKLIPVTAVSNQNTLRRVEIHPRNLLLKEETKKVHIKAKAIFDPGEDKIAHFTKYECEWRQNKKPMKESQLINNLSFRKTNKSEMKSLQEIRNFSSKDPDKENSCKI